MANENCPARGIKQKVELEGVAKLTEPQVVLLGVSYIRNCWKKLQEVASCVYNILQYISKCIILLF